MRRRFFATVLRALGIVVAGLVFLVVLPLYAVFLLVTAAAAPLRRLGRRAAHHLQRELHHGGGRDRPAHP